MRRAVFIAIATGLILVLRPVGGGEAHAADLPPDVATHRASAFSSCTGYYSDVSPPQTIVVWDNAGSGSTTSRPFKDYVKESLSREVSFSGWPMPAYQAVAMAVMTFAWYHANNGPHYTPGGQCWDIATSMQAWVRCPGDVCPSAQAEAVDSIFAASRMTRSGAIFEASHRSGYSGDTCGQWAGSAAPGSVLSQYGAKACADQGYMWYGIINRYYFYSAAAPAYVRLVEDQPAATEFNTPGLGQRLYVFALDRIGRIYWNIYNPNSNLWYGWFQISGPGGGGVCTSPPAALGYSTTDLWVFCRGTDGAIYAKRYNGSSWGSWVWLGGLAMSGPAATEYNQPNDGYQLEVYHVGTDGNVYRKFCRPSQGCAWSGWSSVGSPPGGCTTTPAVDWRSTTEKYLFCRGTDATSGGSLAHIWYTMWNGSSWGAWAILAGQLLDSAASATDFYMSGEGWRVHVNANTQYGNVWENVRRPTGWNGWVYFGGICISGPGASDLPTTAYLFFFCRGNAPNGDVYYRRWTSGGWDAWADIGRPP